MGKTAATGGELATDVYSGTLGSATQSSAVNMWGAFNLFVYGTYTASWQLEKSFDGGATWVIVTPSIGAPVSSTTANASIAIQISEPERGMLYRVNCTAYTSGTINWRMSTTAKSVTYGA